LRITNTAFNSSVLLTTHASPLTTSQLTCTVLKPPIFFTGARQLFRTAASNGK